MVSNGSMGHDFIRIAWLRALSGGILLAHAIVDRAGGFAQTTVRILLVLFTNALDLIDLHAFLHETGHHLGLAGTRLHALLDGL